MCQLTDCATLQTIESIPEFCVVAVWETKSEDLGCDWLMVEVVVVLSPPNQRFVPLFSSVLHPRVDFNRL